MSLKLMNAIAGAISAPRKPGATSADPAENKAMGQPAGARPYNKPMPGEHGSPVEDMDDDHDQGDGEKFGIDELEQHLCPDCHTAVKHIAAQRGGTRGNHA